MQKRLPISLCASLLLTCILLLSSSLPTFAAPLKQTHIVKKNVTTHIATSQIQTDLPYPSQIYPSWWKSGTICDTDYYSGSTPLSSQAFYRGVPACGPKPGQELGYGPVPFPVSGWGEYEWQCTELSMRFMTLAYDVPAYYATGDQVVSNYQTYNPNDPILRPIKNPTMGMEPQQGDILSYAGTKAFPAGHTSVVMATNYQSPGYGTITVLEENFSAKGTQPLQMNNWKIGSGVIGWLHHTLDIIPQTAPASSVVTMNGTNFHANEQVVITFDGETQIGSATTDGSGAFSTTITIPTTAQSGLHTVQAIGQSSGISPKTAFYVGLASTPRLSLSAQSGPPTTTVEMRATNLNPNETLNLSFDTTQIGTVTTDSSGTFFTTVTIPASALPGLHTLQASDPTNMISVQGSFLVQTDWATDGFGPQHTSFNPYENILNTSNVANLTQDWSMQTSATIERQSYPVVANGIVYIGDDSGTLYAFDATTGSLLWSNTIVSNQDAYGIETAPTVANGLVYIGADNLYILDGTTGNLIKTIPVPQAGDLSSPTIVNGVIYVGGSSGEVAALNASDGSLLWQTSVGNIIAGAPAVVNGIVYVDTIHTGLLVALNAKTGKILWNGSLLEGANAAPVVANGMVFVHAYYEGPPASVTLYAFNASGCGSGVTTCSPVWQVSAPSSGDVLPSPAVANGVVYIGTSDMNAFDAKTGAPHWTGTTSSRTVFESSPAVANGVVYSITENGQIYAFKASGCHKASCSPIWTYTIANAATQSSPAVANGIVYIGAFNSASPYSGLVFAFHLPNTTS